MRTLNEITAAIRSGGTYTEDEARYAVVAYDVMVAQLQVPENPVQLQHYFLAAESSPIEYIGWANDPDNPEAVAWYKAMNHVGEQDGNDEA